MGPKSRLPPKAKKSTSSAKSLNSPDDFQAAAEFEENAGGKWRAGDKAKSARAFMRAIEMYNQGLAKHPRNFDLAYNKARLEFEIAEQPALVAKSPISRQEFLQQALTSHKYALRLNEENTDILFNTAQILITLSEDIVEEYPSSKLDTSLPSSWLEEALELLNSCFSRQEMLYEEQTQAWQEAEADDGSGGVSLPHDDASLQRPNPTSSTSSNNEQDAEEEATVEAAIQPSDLLDTAHSSLSALTQLIELSSLPAAQTLRAMADTLLATKIPHYQSLLPTPERAPSRSATALATASLRAALASTECAAGNIAPAAYVATLHEVFEPLPDLARDAEASCTYADALLECAASLLPDPRAVQDGCALEALVDRAVSLYAAALPLLSAPPPPSGEGRATLTLSLAPSTPVVDPRVAAVRESRGDAFLLARRLVLRAGTVGPKTTGGEQGSWRRGRGRSTALRRGVTAARGTSALLPRRACGRRSRRSWVVPARSAWWGSSGRWAGWITEPRMRCCS